MEQLFAKSQFYKLARFIVGCMIAGIAIVCTVGCAAGQGDAESSTASIGFEDGNDVNDGNGGIPNGASLLDQGEEGGAEAGAQLFSNMELAIGDTAEVENGIFLTVNSARLSSEGIIEVEGVFCLVDCTIENRGAESAHIGTFARMYLKDGDGMKYGESTLALKASYMESNIEPGDKTSGEVAYNVPADAGELYFYYEASSYLGAGVYRDYLNRWKVLG